MIRNKLKLKKAGFTLIEVLAAIVISSISLLAMIKISVEATKQSIVNQAGDRATQIYSATSQKLLNIKGSTSITGTLFCIAAGTATSSSDTANDTFQPIFLKRDDPPNETVIKLYKNISDLGLPQGKYTNKLASQVLASQSNGAQLLYNIDFVQDNAMENKDIDSGFYRSIGMDYQPTYKTVNVRIVIYWSLYGVDHYYVNYNIFNVSEC